MIRRRGACELILKALFQAEVGRFSADEVLETVHEAVRTEAEDWTYVQATVRGVSSDMERLDRIIGFLAEGWRLDRLAKVDKNVLRMALFELIQHPEFPTQTVVNDAIEIARKYSMEDSGKFVNGILGSFLRRREELLQRADGVEMGAR